MNLTGKPEILYFNINFVNWIILVTKEKKIKMILIVVASEFKKVKLNLNYILKNNMELLT